MTTVFKDPQTAYTAFDLQGQGKLYIQNILNHRVIEMVCANNKWTKADVTIWLYRDGIFKKTEDHSIDFLLFKKFFFPQFL